jgi:hypothetical protein
VVRVGVVKVPDVVVVPVQPFDAVQVVALVDDQVITEVPLPLTTEVGLALIVTVGAANIEITADCVVVPPVPVQVRL